MRHFSAVGNRVRMIYDDQMQHGDDVKAGYADYMRYAPRKESVRWANEPLSDKPISFLPLQAADLVALHLFRDYRNQQQGVFTEDWVWSALKGLKNIDQPIWDEATLRKVIPWNRMHKHR